MNTCNSTKSRCQCRLLAGHEGYHECRCLGSWDQEGNVVRYPQLTDSGQSIVVDEFAFWPDTSAVWMGTADEEKK